VIGESWSCHVCQDERPDALISVQSRTRWLDGGIEMRENLRYCNDRPRCVEAAKIWGAMPNPEGWLDGLVMQPRLRLAPEPKGRSRMRRSILLLALVVVGAVALVWLVTDADSRPESEIILIREPVAATKQAWWVRRQIEVATLLGKDGDAQGTDPWPNCPDPYDHTGKSWRDTVGCENRAYAEIHGVWDPKAWLDSPGYFRCGLQFEPRWERRYGKLCP
jgi:hypothetical protein